MRMGHLTLDGSKYQANASKHKAMSYGRIEEVEPPGGGDKGTPTAGDRGGPEDAEYGPEQRGDESA